MWRAPQRGLLEIQTIRIVGEEGVLALAFLSADQTLMLSVHACLKPLSHRHLCWGPGLACRQTATLEFVVLHQSGLWDHSYFVG